jgi:glucose uptake protein GlcU
MALYPMPKQTNLLVSILGKLFFSRQQKWKQEKQAKTMLLVIVVGVVFALIVGALLFALNYTRR